MTPGQERPCLSPIRVHVPVTSQSGDGPLASPTGVRVPTPVHSDSLEPIASITRSLFDMPLDYEQYGTTAAPAQLQRPNITRDDARLLRSLRGRPIERIWLESHLTLKTANKDEATKLRSILSSAFLPAKRQASKHRKKVGKVKHATVHSDSCSVCSADSRLSYHSRYCRACKMRKCTYCGLTSVVEDMWDGQCAYCLVRNHGCASRLPMRRLGRLLLRRRPGISPQELLDVLCNYGQQDTQVDGVNADLRSDPIVQELRTEVIVLRQATEHLRALVPVSLEEANAQLKDMNEILQRQITELCTQMDTVAVESDRNMAGLAMLRCQKENLEKFLTGIKEHVTRMRQQEKANVDELRVYLLDINKHIDSLNDALIDVSNQQSTTVSAINGLKSAIRGAIRESQASEATLCHRTSRINSLLPADVAQTLKRASQAHHRRASTVVFDDDESVASTIDPTSPGLLLMCPRCHGALEPASVVEGRVGNSSEGGRRNSRNGQLPFRGTGRLGSTEPRAFLSASGRLKPTPL